MGAVTHADLTPTSIMLISYVRFAGPLIYADTFAIWHALGTSRSNAIPYSHHFIMNNIYSLLHLPDRSLACLRQPYTHRLSTC